MEININLRAKQLGVDLYKVSDAMVQNFNEALKNLAKATYAEMVEQAKQTLVTSREDYLKDLEFDEIGKNTYMIWLEGASNYIEDGWNPFNQVPGLVNGPKSKSSKSGYRYNIVPFRHQPYAKSKAKANVQDLRTALQGVIKTHGLKKIFKKEDGTPKTGIVAKVTGLGMENLEGVVKIQGQYDKAVQSMYYTFRGVSNDPQSKTMREGKWKHPGYGGFKLFEKTSAFLEKEVDKIILKILKG